MRVCKEKWEQQQQFFINNFIHTLNTHRHTHTHICIEKHGSLSQARAGDAGDHSGGVHIG